jgi:hypothetical protein
MTFVVDDARRDGLELPSPTEAADIAEIVRGILAIQAQAADKTRRPLSRGTHAKGICVRAEFEVLDIRRTLGDSAVADRLAKGLFAAPGIYPATVRFANADGGHRPDRARDVRALSFAVDVPPGVLSGVTRLDFSMNTGTTFPINDAHAFAVSVRVLSAKGVRAKLKALRSLTWKEVGELLRVIRLGAQQKRRTPRGPYQQLRYWSTVPFLHGGRDAVKYSAIPHENPARPLQPGPNFLQDELVRHVNEDERMSAFDFAVQLLDPSRMTHRGKQQDPRFWVENAAVEWNEQEAPFHVVARLRLLPKSVLSPAESEAFAIDVTEHSTPETRPIGSINRARWHGESASREARLAQPVAATAWTPANRGRRVFLAATAVALLGFAAAAAWALRPAARNLPEMLSYPSAPLGANGLSAEERQQYYHLSEGGEAFPIAWLLALEQQVTINGRTIYRPFLENIERFGLIPDPPSRYNPYGLPVGVTAGYGKITGQQMMGLNCTACHVGELHHNGRAFRVDGGPSMAYINAFITAIVNETSATAEDRGRRLRFLDRWRRMRLVALPDFPVTRAATTYTAGGTGATAAYGSGETLDAAAPNVVWRVLAGLRMALSNRALLMDKLHTFKAVKLVSQAQPLGTVDGYGRNDAFGVGRNELFGAYTDKDFTLGLNVLPADAPVSFPHLWGMERTSWFQWGVNTNSVIERNIGQHRARRQSLRHGAPAVQTDVTPMAGGAVRSDRSGPRRTRQEGIRPYLCPLPRNIREDRHPERIPAVPVGHCRHRSQCRHQLRTNGHDGGRSEAVRHRSVRGRTESEGCLLSGQRDAARRAGTMGSARPASTGAVPRTAARIRQVPRHAAARYLPRQDAEGDLGDRAFSAQRIGAECVRPAAAGGPAPEDVPARNKRVRRGEARIRRQRTAPGDTARHGAVHLRHQADRQLEHRP